MPTVDPTQDGSSHDDVTAHSPGAITTTSHPGQTLSGKQEHCSFVPTVNLGILSNRANTHLTDLKRELVAEQVNWEISELNSPTALHRFGAPFKSNYGEVSPLDSELPILRYIFVHHVREFPFLDKAKEKEFWQDKLQVVCNSTQREEARVRR